MLDQFFANQLANLLGRLGIERDHLAVVGDADTVGALDTLAHEPFDLGADPLAGSSLLDLGRRHTIHFVLRLGVFGKVIEATLDRRRRVSLAEQVIGLPLLPPGDLRHDDGVGQLVGLRRVAAGQVDDL